MTSRAYAASITEHFDDLAVRLERLLAEPVAAPPRPPRAKPPAVDAPPSEPSGETAVSATPAGPAPAGGQSLRQPARVAPRAERAPDPMPAINEMRADADALKARLGRALTEVLNRTERLDGQMTSIVERTTAHGEALAATRTELGDQVIDLRRTLDATRVDLTEQVTGLRRAVDEGLASGAARMTNALAHPMEAPDLELLDGVAGALAEVLTRTEHLDGLVSSIVERSTAHDAALAAIRSDTTDQVADLQGSLAEGLASVAERVTAALASVMVTRTEQLDVQVSTILERTTSQDQALAATRSEVANQVTDLRRAVDEALKATRTELSEQVNDLRRGLHKEVAVLTERVADALARPLPTPEVVLDDRFSLLIRTIEGRYGNESQPLDLGPLDHRLDQLSAVFAQGLADLTTQIKGQEKELEDLRARVDAVRGQLLQKQRFAGGDPRRTG